MRKIALIGAGRSTSYLVKYLVEYSEKENWSLTIADKELSPLYKNIPSPHSVIVLNIDNHEALLELISSSDLVISMLPAHLHLSIARICIDKGVNMATASYLSDEMLALSEEAKKQNVTILNEMGVDPGIDHMSAMNMIDPIKANNGKITHFESFTGGLVAPGYDNNPWQYKFTWNPRNVVIAGQGGAVKFIQEGHYKYIPYNKVFRRTEIVDLGEHGKFEGYANRDSLKYRGTYGLEDVQTMYRGTFRRPGFCRAWNVFVELGATDDSYILEGSEKMTNRDFINTFLAYHPTDSVELKLRQYMGIQQDDVDLWDRLMWLEIFSNKVTGIKNATPAMMLQKILEDKWKLEQGDKDMIVMWHKVRYNQGGTTEEIHSSMVCIGEDSNYTAMAKTVGLPLAIGAKLLINNKISKKGCILPVTPDIYLPILHELNEHNITFNEQIQEDWQS